VLIKHCSAEYLEVELEIDDPGYFRVISAIGAKADGVCKVTVNLLRQGLTDEICYKNFQERGRQLLADVESQQDLW